MFRCTVVFSIWVCLNCVGFVLCESASNQCQSIVDGPFDACTKAGYNNTMPFPDFLTEPIKDRAAMVLNYVLSETKNCSQNGVAEAIDCGFIMPQCAQGKRLYPCKRVCGEYLKQCEKVLPEFGLDYIIASCHVLPDEDASSGQCFEPPNFKTNDSVPGPLDRGCQELLFPACKNLGLYNHTFVSVKQQKMFYSWIYGKNYTKETAEQDFPKMAKKKFLKHPKCQDNLKKLFCGEIVPPCFHEKGPGLTTLCKSVCDDIVRNCPGVFSEYDHFIDAEICGYLAEGNTSHGFCHMKEWPAPFVWMRFLEDHVDPTRSPKSTGPKAWVIAVAVVVPLIVVGLIVAAAVWWKCYRLPGVGYKKHTEEDDAAAMET